MRIRYSCILIYTSYLLTLTSGSALHIIFFPALNRDGAVAGCRLVSGQIWLGPFSGKGS